VFRQLAVTTLFALLAACNGAGTSASAFVPPPSAAPGVYFEVRTAPSEAPFIVLVTDPETIGKGRALAGTSNTTVVSGVVVAAPVWYNPNWAFYLRPDSVRMPEVTVEVCQATATYVQQHLSDVGKSFLPDSQWCAVGTQIIREISP